mmetsp:Transcript_26617/g.26861  ORF Transcript_26617/g.26861 Transcript_26617/m.26861 type:complete len:352 (+) Transcript_26617:89-1144(+)
MFKSRAVRPKIRNESESPSIEKPESIKFLLTILQNTPVLNLLYSALIDDSADIGGVKEALNVFAIVNALLLGVVAAIPFSVSFNELTEADLRFRTTLKRSPQANVTWGSYYYDLYTLKHAESDPNFEYNAPSVYVMSEASEAFIMLSISLLAVIIVYLHIVFCDLENEKKFTAWWGYFKWGVCLILLTTLYGVVRFIGSLNAILWIKFPDPLCPTPSTTAINDRRCVFQKLEFFFSVIYLGIGIPFCLLCGLATGAVYRRALVEKKDPNMKTKYFEFLQLAIYPSGEMSPSDIQTIKKYVKRFIDHDVLLEDMPLITNEILLKEIRMSNVSHRLRILEAAKNNKNKGDNVV